MLLLGKEDVISSLYKQFSFVEPDVDKFKFIATYNNNTKTILDFKKRAKKNIEEYMASIIIYYTNSDNEDYVLQTDGISPFYQFVCAGVCFKEFFRKCVHANGAEFAFHFFNYFKSAYEVNVTYDDLLYIQKDEFVNIYLSELVKKHPAIAQTGDLSFTTNSLLADVLVVFIKTIPDEEEEIIRDNATEEEQEDLDFDDEELLNSEVNVSLINDEATRYLYMSGGSNVLDSKVMDEEVLKMRSGDEEAAKKVISSVNKLILSLANYYARRATSLTVEDLCQEGQIGLLHAVKIYDVSKNAKFTTHAVYWIRQAMQRAIHNKDRSVRVPVHKHILMNTIRRCRREFTNENLREPTLKELSSLTGISQNEIDELIKLDEQPVSLDKPVGDDDDASIGDFIDSGVDAAERFVDDSELSEHSRIVRESLEILNDKELFVVVNYFGLNGKKPKTTPEIAVLMGTTHQNVCQKLSKAMRKLKNQNGILIDRAMPGLKTGTSSITADVVIARKQRATEKLRYKTRGKIEIITFDDIAQYGRFCCTECGFKWQSKITTFVRQNPPRCPNCYDRIKEETKDIFKGRTRKDDK